MTKGVSSRFAFFADKTHFAVVAGAQEGDAVELALAYAVRHANGRATTLVLPDDHMNATAQRIPWLKQSARPAVHVHRDGCASLVPEAERSQADTVRALVVRLEPQTPAEELASRDEAAASRSADRFGVETGGARHAATAGSITVIVGQSDHGTTPASGCCRSVARTTPSLSRQASTTAELLLPNQCWCATTHASPMNNSTPFLMRSSMQSRNADRVRRQSIVPTSIGSKRSSDGTPRSSASNNPLYANCPHGDRATPPPAGAEGFIDLAGLDGHGDIRIVETKLADNADDLLVLQGLDYYVWASAYEQALRQRLGTADHARLELHYVLGANAESGKVKVSQCTKPLADALDPDAVRWRFQTVRDWYKTPDDPTPVDSHTSELFEVLCE